MRETSENRRPAGIRFVNGRSQYFGQTMFSASCGYKSTARRPLGAICSTSAANAAWTSGVCCNTPKQYTKSNRWRRNGSRTRRPGRRPVADAVPDSDGRRRRRSSSRRRQVAPVPSATSANSPGSASKVERPATRHVCRRPSGLREESIARDRLSGEAVELRVTESIPLEAEAARVVLERHESRNETDNRVLRAASRTRQCALTDLRGTLTRVAKMQIAAARRAHQEFNRWGFMKRPGARVEAS